MERCYVAIDLKSFYASVECVERGLDPLKAKLVVADETRTEKTICLAVSPALKALGISGRARLYEVLNKIPRSDFIIAPPRMNKYMEISSKIFKIYGSFVAPEDIHVYSIDEVFIDLTNYLKNYEMTAYELTLTMIRKVLDETGITATAGIGSNLYLAKIAMDIEAKRMEPDGDGVRIAELNERSYREKLWDHTPITDFWRIGPGYSRRLLKYGINSMGDLAKYSLVGADKLYREFGVNAELLIDHAWGFESVTISDIKNYHSDNHSISMGQVLSNPYSYQKARLIILEMADSLALDLVRKGLVSKKIVLTVEYDICCVKDYKGETVRDRYGREVPKHAHGTIDLGVETNSSNRIFLKTGELYDHIVNRGLKIRKMYLVADKIKYESDKNKFRQLSIFTDYEDEKKTNEKEKRRQKAILEIKAKYGNNSILRGMNFENGATMRERNLQIGGHKA